MDKELLEILNKARAKGANKAQLQTIVDSYKKKNQDLSSSTSENQSLDSDQEVVDGSLDTPKGQLAKGIDDGKFDERIEQLKAENKITSKSSYVDQLGRSWNKGVSRLGRDIASSPEFIYDLFAIPQNYLADKKNQPLILRMITDKFDVESLETSSEKLKEFYGVDNTVKDLYNKDIQELNLISEKLDEKYEGGITDNFKAGNYSDGFKLLGLSIVESMPASLAIAASGGTASAPQILAGTTAVFGAGANEEYKAENPNMNPNERTVKAFGKGFAEGVFSTIGTSRIGAAAKEIIAREGKEEGAKILKAELIDMYTELLKKYPIPSAMVGEGLEEAATQMTQNAIDGKDVMEGVSDAFLVGMGSGGTFGIGLEGLKKVTNNKLSANDIENIESLKDKDQTIKTELSEQVKDGDLKPKEAKDIYDNWEEIKSNLQAVPDDFTPEQKAKAVEIIKEKNALEKDIEGKDSALVEDKKTKIEELNNQLKNINNTDAKTQEATQETKKQEVETVTPETEVESEKGVEDELSPTVELNPENTNEINPVKELETQRDQELAKLEKPQIKLALVSAKDLVNSKDPIGNKQKHNDIKDRYKKLKALMDCL